MTAGAGDGQEDAFIATKEHRRFVEFAKAVRQHPKSGTSDEELTKEQPGRGSRDNAGRRFGAWRATRSPNSARSPRC